MPHEAAARHPYPLLFARVGGARLYGFPSPDSDYDRQGLRLLPMADCVGLPPSRDTVELSGMRGGLEMNLVTHDAHSFFEMLLQRNG